VVGIWVGGVGVELADTGVVGMAPVSPTEAADLVGARPAALLDGFLGEEPLDRVALGLVIAAVGDLLVDNLAIAEIDCNPLRMTSDGPVALDALVTVVIRADRPRGVARP
jgi:hypothetical protein